MDKFEEAVKSFEAKIGKVSKKNEAEWFYYRGRMDAHKEALKRKEVS